jgi:AcrR family transcriptional regulator
MTPSHNGRRPLSRDQIVSTAQELFSGRGYAHTSIEDIAARLGVRKGAVYYHVPKKSDLLIEVIAGLLRPIAVHAEQVAAGRYAPRDKLDDLVANHVSRLLLNQDAATVFFEQRADVPEDAELVSLSARIDSAFDAVLASGVADGSFRDETVALLRLHVLALCNWPYRWFSPRGRLTTDEVAASVQRHVRAIVDPSLNTPSE